MKFRPKFIKIKFPKFGNNKQIEPNRLIYSFGQSGRNFIMSFYNCLRSIGDLFILKINIGKRSISYKPSSAIGTCKSIPFSYKLNLVSSAIRNFLGNSGLLINFPSNSRITIGKKKIISFSFLSPTISES